MPGFNQADPIVQRRARELRRPLSPPEAKIWSRLRDRRLDGHKFRRQHPIGSYILDFYCQEQRLVVELDGDSHASQVDYDRRRTEWLEARGYRVLRFTNREVANNLEGVLGAILQACSEAGRGGPSP